MSRKWNWIWKLPYPQRLKFFVWLLLHEKLAVNAYRFHIGAADSSACDRCLRCEETILHLLRDCDMSRRLWERIVHQAKRVWFFMFECWLCRNLVDKGGIGRIANMEWSDIFMASVWTIWKARNDQCFNNVQFLCNRVMNQARPLVGDMQLRVEGFHGIHLDPMNGRWFRPPPGYVKLNVDWSVRDGEATYGGLLRDDICRWQWGFSSFCGCSSPLYAELLALKEGLQGLLHHQCLRVIVESDSSEVVQLVNGLPDEDHPLLQLILDCKRFHSKFLNCTITYVSRTYNYSADCLAKFGHTLCTQLGTF